MALGAFVDLGVDSGRLRAELEKLHLDGWTLEFARDERCGIGGTRATVALGRECLHGHHHGHHHGHEHNSWREIRALIEGSGVSVGAKERALAIFTRIACAEAEVHGCALDEVAFHEVGALDSIIDIVGTAICLDELGPDRITCSAVELGGGVARCAHGVLPVPAPATLLLVKGMPVKTGGFDKEMTTPTGAAILAASVDEFVTEAAFTEVKTGYGIGGWTLAGKPNVLRLSLREADDTITRSLILLEANIDDMTGEEFGFLMERLFEAGALDVTFTPCVMKKSRPAQIVGVLCARETLEAVRRALFVHSTTIGFRETDVRRIELRREGDATVDGLRRKTVFLDGKPLRSKIEFDDRAKSGAVMERRSGGHPPLIPAGGPQSPHQLGGLVDQEGF
jgi:uncharacterized protein (TIGR00299 family) protein